MAKNYETYLRDILLRGLEELENNPTASEVVDIPRSSFKVLIDSFRSGLPSGVSKTLPSYSLSDKKYLQALAAQIKNLLEKPAEAEKILSNMPPLKNLELAYQKAHEKQAAAVAQHQNWKTSFEQQIKQYNLDLAARLDQQLQKAFPSLAGAQNAGKRKILVADMAQTIQDQGLPAIKGDFQPQAQDILKEVAQKTIRQYATEIEDLQTEEIESKPQAREEKIITLSQEIAQEEADAAFAVRQSQIRAESSPAEDPTYKVGAAIETSVIANLGELAQDKELVNAICGEINGKIHRASGRSEAEYQTYIAQQTRAIITQTRVAKILEQKGLNSSQREKIANSVSAPIAEQTTSEIYKIANSSEFGATPFAGSIPFIPNFTNPTIGTDSFGEGSLGDTYLSSGGPLHLFTSLASPHGLQDLAKWTLTAGWARTPAGFILDSLPGLPKLDYFHVSFLMLETTENQLLKGQRQLSAKLAGVATDSIEGYEFQKEMTEANDRLKIINGIKTAIDNNPLLKKSYNLFFKEIEVFGFKTGIPLYNLVHPLESVKMWALGRGPLAHLGISGTIDIFSLTAKYGGAGFAYGAEEYLKMAGILGLKYGLTKIGLYKIVGLPGHRHFVFAPTHAIAVRVQKFIFEKLGGQAIKQALLALAEKLGLTALFGALSGGWSLVVQAGLWFLNKLKKFVAYALGGLLFWLFSNFNLLEILASMAGGTGFSLLTAPLFMPIFGIWGLPISWMMGTFSSAMFIKSLHAVFGPLFEGAGSLFGKGLNFGGNLLTNLLHLPSLASVAFPVLITTVGLLTGGYFYSAWIIQGGFALLEQLPQIQSEHILVEKKVEPFSGKLGEETIKYTLTIGAKKEGEKLINIRISDKTESSCNGTPPSVAERNFTDKIPGEISYGTLWQASYGIPTDNSFNDCLITNTATVTADVENGPTGEQSFYTASVTIGNPPVSVPSIWPLASGCITQGPGGSTSHAAYHEEAIDIDSAASGKQALVTHNGTVIRAVNNQSTSTTGYGNYVVVSGSGPNGSFTTIYAHLQTVLVSVGQKLTVGQTVGLVGSSGNTGTPPGPHLHYEFTGLKLVPPYLPKDINGIRSCDGKINCNLCFP